MAEIGRRWSPYTYGFNNPVRYVDPDGMSPVWNGKYGDESAYIDDKKPDQTYSWDEVQKEYGLGPNNQENTGADKQSDNGQGFRTDKNNLLMAEYSNMINYESYQKTNPNKEVKSSSLKLRANSYVSDILCALLSKMNNGDEITGKELAKLNKGLSKITVVNSLQRTTNGFKTDIKFIAKAVLPLIHLSNVDGATFQIVNQGSMYKITSNEAKMNGKPLSIYIYLNSWSEDGKLFYSIF